MAREARWYWIMSLLCVVASGIFVGVTAVSSKAAFLETDVSNGVGDWQVMKGEWSIRIYGTFDGASVSVETLTEGTPATPTKVTNVSATALVGAALETEWAGLQAGHGSYRINVTGGGGSESITWTGRRVLP